MAGKIDPHFFEVVNRFTELYVSFRRRFVMAANGSIFVPRSNDGYRVLDNKAIIGHLNRRYSIGVFAGTKASKFVCFDVDLHDAAVVRAVIDGLCEFGFPRDHIYVSSSGGKGFHVEMFFTAPVFTDLLRDMYRWVIAEKNLDPRKVEFRPTYKQAIKLPLSVHHKTGNVCWYLDRETLEPIARPDYVLEIRQLDRDFAQELIRQKTKDMPKTEARPKSEPGRRRGVSSYTLTGPGMRHDTMLAIAVRERYKETPQEEIEKILVDWAEEQNPDFITDPWSVVLNDAASLAAFVWREGFVVASRRLVMTNREIEAILSCRAKLQRKVLMLILFYCRRYGAAAMSAARMARIVGATPYGVQKALFALECANLVSRERGKIVRSADGWASSPNRYIFRKPRKKRGEEEVEIEIKWDFKEESFVEQYVKLMRENVERRRWKKVFSKKELEELYNE